VKRPLFVLGVSRSGTTLLRVVLDRSPGIAIPDESFFIPLLARRHRGEVDAAEFLDDLGRLTVLADWGVSVEDIGRRLHPGMEVGAAIAAIYESHAESEGKPRWGDKTPMYMRHLRLLERLFPDAQYVHLVRDGRDAAVSFLRMPGGTYTRTWAHPDTPSEFARLWRTEVLGAHALGERVGAGRYLEVRYEDLVASPDDVVASICAFAELPFVPEMLEYAGEVDVSAKPHQQRLRQPPTVGVRDWRSELGAEEALSFEAVAGDLLAALGYPLLAPAPRRPALRARLGVRLYRTRLAAWNLATSLVQRSPLWRVRHPARPGRRGFFRAGGSGST
jgi:Sulfotransferase family